jgi:hypothetical protein
VSQGTEQQQRMQGLPCRGLVDCQGDLFIYAGAVEQIAWIAQALSSRVCALRCVFCVFASFCCVFACFCCVFACFCCVFAMMPCYCHVIAMSLPCYFVCVCGVFRSHLWCKIQDKEIIRDCNTGHN